MKLRHTILKGDCKTYNIGQYMTNGGLILAATGILTAMIGNRLRINSTDERLILGHGNPEKMFSEMYQSIIKEKP